MALSTKEMQEMEIGTEIKYIITLNKDESNELYNELYNLLDDVSIIDDSDIYNVDKFIDILDKIP